MSAMYIYYVYAYLRSKDSTVAKAGTPYYIGKGKGKRAQIKKKGEVYPPKDKELIILLETNLSDVGAFALERRLIQRWGRIDLNTGILRNKTDGGEGISGASETTRLKLRTSNLGKKQSLETCQRKSKSLKGKIPWNKGIKWSAHSMIMTGKKQSIESNKKRSITMKGRIPWNKGKSKLALV